MKRLLVLLVIVCIFFSSYSSSKKSVVVENSKYLEGDKQMTISSDNYLLEESFVKFVQPKTNKEKFLTGFKVENATLNLDCENGTDYVGTACLMNVTDLSKQVTPYSVVVVGDVNGDGKQTITDIVKVATYAEKKSGLSKETYVLAADYDNDDNISSKDTNSLAYYMVGNDELPLVGDSTVGKNIELITKTLMLSKGSSSKIEYKMNGSDVSSVEWKSSDEKVVTVDPTGFVTGVGAGNATISVKDSNGDTASMQVSVVVVVPDTGVILDESTLEMDKGSTKKLTPTVSPGNATNKKVTWKSGDPAIVKVDSSGNITAVAKGSTTITVTTATGKTASVVVNVKVPATGISLNSTNLTLVKGLTATLTPTISPSDVSNNTVDWHTGNPAVATVKDGVVTAVAPGMTIITATTGDGKKSVTCNVVVEEIKVTLANKLTLMDEQVKTLKSEVSPSIADQNVTWSSSDTSIATVSKTGKVTAKKTGTVTITATSVIDSNVKAECTVTVRARKILFVGNSVTYYPTGDTENGETIPTWFVNMAKSAGYEFVYSFAKKGGASLDEIYKNYPNQQAKMEKSYDYVVLQEALDEYTDSSSISRYYTGVSEIVETVKAKKSNVQIFIRKQWAKKNSTKATIDRGYANTDAVISKLKVDYGYDAYAINDGPAMYDALNTYGDTFDVFYTKNDGTKDLRHQSSEGAYLSALCIYSTILDADPTKVGWVPSQVKSENAVQIRPIVKNYCYNT